MSARIDTAAERARLDGLTGHDPAPWCTEYDEWDSLHVTTLERLNEPLVPIAKVGVDYDEPFKSRQQACASLIAAAPDLLAGYRAALDEIDRLTAALAEAEDRGAAQMRERAAALVASSAEMINLKTGERLLDSRPAGSLTGLAFAHAIRALPLRDPGAAP